MDKAKLDAPPAWATTAQVAVLALSVALLLLPELRGKSTWVGLLVLYALAIGNTTYRDWRAGRLHMRLREGARHHAQSTPAALRMLEFAAAMLGCVAIVVSSPRF
ncbi:MAG: hypothetical protein Q8K45_18245 [Rubrivivax sp.]|nr:hypothetical protein [Rubrivivax sp.]